MTRKKRDRRKDILLKTEDFSDTKTPSVRFLSCELQSNQIHRDRKRMVVTSGWGESEWGLVFNGCRVSVGVDKRIPDVNGGDGCTMRMYSML
jgi:hypothetical protein